MRKVIFFVWLFLVGFLLYELSLAQTALVMILVSVPVVVATAIYPNWRETEAPTRELVGFWLGASFLGVFPVFVKVFLWMYRDSLLAVPELLGGLAGLVYFTVTLLTSVGEPLLRYLPGIPTPLGQQPGSGEHLGAIAQVAERSGARLQAVYTVPATVLGRGPVRFAGLGTTNLYLTEEAVGALSPQEVAFLVGTELWHVRHRDLWWNLAVYYTWLIFVAFHVWLGWALVAVVGGVTFSILWPLASRLKQLAADRYAARLTREAGAALTALSQLPALIPGVPAQPRGWRALFRLLFTYEVPVGLRVHSLCLAFRRSLEKTQVTTARAWRREGVRFWLLQVLLVLGVSGLVALPSYLRDRQIVSPVLVRGIYLVLAVALYAPFTAYTLTFAYQAFLAPGEGAPVRRLPAWSVVAPLVVFLASVLVTMVAGLDPGLIILALAASAGLLGAGLAAGEVEALRRPTVRAP